MKGLLYIVIIARESDTEPAPGNFGYRICLIRCHGYYLFRNAILCGYYIRERLLFESGVYLTQRCCHCHWCRDWGARPLCRQWQGRKRVGGERSCSRRQLVLCFLLSLNLITLILLSHESRGFVHVRTYYSNKSRGWYSSAVTISFSTSGGAASIQEQLLIKSSVWSSEYSSMTQMHMWSV